MTMVIEQKLKLLSTIQNVFDDFSGQGASMACSRGCSVCCTTDMVGTSLEAVQMLKALKAADREDLIAGLSEIVKAGLFRPRVTTNAMAMACLRQEDPPVEEPGPDPSPCPFLQNDECVIYEDRPFSCRGMFSQERCRPGSEAVMPPDLIAVVTVCWQIIEHLDVGGLYGNLIELVETMSDGNKAFAYQTGAGIMVKGVPPTRPIPGLLVPQEDTETVNRFLARLFQADVEGQDFRTCMGEVRNSPF